MQSDARTILPDELWMFLQALPPILHLRKSSAQTHENRSTWIYFDQVGLVWSAYDLYYDLYFRSVPQSLESVPGATASSCCSSSSTIRSHLRNRICALFLWPFCALYCTILNSENLKPQRIWTKLRQASFGNRQSSSPSRSQRLLWSTNLCGAMPAGATGATGLALGNRLVLQSLRIQRNQDSDSDFEIAGISNSSKPTYSASSSGLFWILCISCWISALTSAKGGLMARKTSRQNATRWPFLESTDGRSQNSILHWRRAVQKGK